ncbi:MAG: hypothetical protein IKW48_09030 [Akkermansia sp.]|nr:hypothetical protein [Akkermansia sp.]
MKKTFITLLALAGAASAATTQVWDLSQSVTSGDFLYNAETGLFTDNTNVEGTVLNGVDGSSKIQTNISFTLNLTAAQTVTGDTKLLKMDMSGDIGLALTSTGLAGTWGDSTSGRGSVTFETLLADSGVFADIEGNKYITLTFVEAYGSGVQVWSNTTKLINDSALKSSGNTSLTSIYVNSGYVEALQFETEWKGDDIVNTNVAFNAEAMQVIPEPATATLSLLALASLAARRRRK